MSTPQEPDELARLRPRAWVRPHSIHWAALECLCVLAVYLFGGPHGFGANFAAPFVLFGLLALVHALAEFALPEQRGPVHPVFTLAVVGLPLALPCIAKLF